jgi:hypothetical protein
VVKKPSKLRSPIATQSEIVSVAYPISVQRTTRRWETSRGIGKVKRRKQRKVPEAVEYERRIGEQQR